MFNLANGCDGIWATEGAASQRRERGKEAGDDRRLRQVPGAVGVFEDNPVVEEFEAAHRRHGKVGRLNEQFYGRQLRNDLKMPELLALNFGLTVDVPERGRAESDHDVVAGLVQDPLAGQACLDNAINIDRV